MKHHKNRSRAKRQLVEAVRYKWNFKKRNFAISALSAAALIGMSTASWADSSNQTTLSEVVVTGDQDKNKNAYNAQNISLTKYTQPILDTPQSITVISNQQMSDQGVTTMRDALRDVPGISIAAGEAGAQGDSMTLRGFTARNDIYLDGMRDFGSYYRDAFDWDQVEVLEGPSSIAFGRGSTGGVVNQVSKMPENYREITGDLSYGTDQRNRETVDINQPIPHLAPGAAVRLNVMNEQANVTDRDVVENSHFGVAPAITIGLGTPTRATLTYLHEEEHDVPDYGLPWYLNGPAPVSRNNFYGFRSDYLDTNADIVTAKVEHDINDDVTVSDQVRYGDYTRHIRATEPQFVTAPTLSTPLSSILVKPNEIALDSEETFLQNQLNLTSHFKTAFLDHTLVTGTETGRETSDPTRWTYNMPASDNTSLLNPDYDRNFSPTSVVERSSVKATVDTFAVYGLDTIKLNEHWDLMGGLRWDQSDSRYKDGVAHLGFSRTDKMTSYRGALVYKPVENGSIYFDYGTSFNPSAETLSLSAATANIAPEKNETYEVGTKWDLFKKKLSLRSAIFRTDKTNAREPDPTNPLLNVLAGEQLVEGIELEAAGHLTDKWQLSAGYEYLKSREEKSNDFPGAVGSQLANVPANTFNFWTTYDLPWKLTIGGGGNFVDERTASSTVPIDPVTGLVKEVPSYWAFNAMLEYHLNKNVDIQLNVYNLANKYYIDQVHPAHLIPGEGRTAIVSTKFKF